MAPALTDFLKTQNETCDIKEMWLSPLRHEFNIDRMCSEQVFTKHGSIVAHFVVTKFYLNRGYKPGFFSNDETQILYSFKVPAFMQKEINYCELDTYQGSEGSIFFQKVTMSNPRPAFNQLFTQYANAKQKLLVTWEPDVANQFG